MTILKKEALIHFGSALLFLLVISLFKRYFSIGYIGFWIGGILGTLAPDIDHLLYLYLLKPQEATSQRVRYMFQKGEVLKTFQLMVSTRSERKDLVFHNLLVQSAFLVLVFWVLSSSGSLLGRGFVLAFGLHLSVDQIVDFLQMDNINNWTKKLPIELTREQAALVAIGFLVVLSFLALFV